VPSEKLVSLRGAEDINTHLARYPHPLKQAANHASKFGGGAILVKSIAELPIIVSTYHPLVQERWLYQKERIIRHLSTVPFPEERQVVASMEWSNSATSADQLVSHANQVVGPFLSILHGTAEKSGSRIFCGEGNAFLLKNRESLERKVRVWSSVGGKPENMIRKINDQIRGTVICVNITQLKDAISQFQDLVGKQGWEIVFSNKFKENYPSGYVGVHCKLKMKFVTPEGEKIEMLGEVQFHLEQIHDGTLSSPKETAHRVLDETRKTTSSDLLRICDQAMLVIYGSALEQVTIPPVYTYPV
jgi:hypothetical protein